MYGKEFPDEPMILGSPAKVVKQLSPEHIQNIERIADHYVENATRFRVNLKKIG
jgi:carbonic anhydrase/acetyltransferase-like protein (isoleucine patch superfamily)